MRRGHLADYFEGVGVKTLSAVETDPGRSHQHEFNGVAPLAQILGDPSGHERYEATFLYLADEEDEFFAEDVSLTWYDARAKARNERGVMRWEYRIYYPANRVMEKAEAGDLLILAIRPEDPALVIVAKAESTAARQILWLFGCEDPSGPDFFVRPDLDTERDRIEFASRQVLEYIGVEVDVADDRWLEEMLAKFRGGFPTTREFSAYARSTLPGMVVADDPDAALMTWLEREEVLFRTMERHLVAQRLEAGFEGKVDEFISYSLSVQNRRKSRAGMALENHLEHLFGDLEIRHTRNPVTEHRSRPDFVFPGIAEYHDAAFEVSLLTMLGVKSSCKERWRQVLAEADRIERKHLLTLEAPISESQTDQMRSHDLQLVVPAGLHGPYIPKQQQWLLDLQSFTRLVCRRQTG